MAPKAVAVFTTRSVQGDVTFSDRKNGLYIEAIFTKLPKGKHGFHIHKAGDLRGEGCKLACDHYHKGPPCSHGGPPGPPGERHTGDLGNVEGLGKYTYLLRDVWVDDIIGRSIIVP
jgi:Cu-Zn family superoxide dismutase